jgi:hypothetical protein
MRKFPRSPRCKGEAPTMKLDPAAEALIGTHTISGGIRENIDTGEVNPAPDITITITRELVTKARMLGWSGAELFAEAIRQQTPGPLTSK